MGCLFSDNQGMGRGLSGVGGEAADTATERRRNGGGGGSVVVGFLRGGLVSVM